MIIPDKKKMATAIVAKLGTPEAEAEEAADSHETLAAEILDAVKSGSAGKLADALRAFYAECELREE